MPNCSFAHGTDEIGTPINPVAICAELPKEFYSKLEPVSPVGQTTFPPVEGIQTMPVGTVTTFPTVGYSGSGGGGFGGGGYGGGSEGNGSGSEDRSHTP